MGEETLAAYSIASQQLKAHCRQTANSYISDIDESRRHDDSEEKDGGQRARPTVRSSAPLVSHYTSHGFLFPSIFLLYYSI